MILSNKEKVEIIKDRINQLNIHIDTLSESLISNPGGDTLGKPTRIEVIDAYNKQIKALEDTLRSLEQFNNIDAII